MRLDADFLRELEALRRRLVIKARSGAAGERLSRRRGSSAEFEDHRPYAPGDDPRRLDWNAFARTGEPVVKLFRAEEDSIARVILDASESMNFGEPSKFETAQRLAAAVAYMTLAGTERAQLFTLSDSNVRPSTPARGRNAFGSFVRGIDATQASGSVDLALAIDTTLRQALRPGLFVVLSDFFDSGPLLAALKRARASGHDLGLIQVVAPEEVSPNFEGDVLLEDAESGETVELTADAASVEAYALRFAGLCEELRGFARKHGATYVRARTDEPLEDVVRRFVARATD